MSSWQLNNDAGEKPSHVAGRSVPNRGESWSTAIKYMHSLDRAQHWPGTDGDTLFIDPLDSKNSARSNLSVSSQMVSFVLVCIDPARNKHDKDIKLKNSLQKRLRWHLDMFKESILYIRISHKQIPIQPQLFWGIHSHWNRGHHSKIKALAYMPNAAMNEDNGMLLILIFTCFGSEICGENNCKKCIFISGTAMRFRNKTPMLQWIPLLLITPLWFQFDMDTCM